MATASEATEQANRAGMDPKRLLIGFLMVAGVVLALFFANILELVWAKAGWPNPSLVEGLDWNLTTVLGAVVGIGAAAVGWFHPRAHGLMHESASELMKVTWPTWGETRVATVAVVVASLVASFILFGIDSIAYQVMVEWLPRLWGKL